MKKKSNLGLVVGKTAYIIPALYVLGLVGTSGAAGYVAAKLAAPSVLDLLNLLKLYRLARLVQDNLTQRMLAEKEAIDKIIDELKNPKTMRVF